MAMDMKLDIGALAKGLFSKKGKDGQGKKVQSSNQRYIIVGFLIFLLVIAYVFVVYLPAQKEIREKQAKVDSIQQLTEELLILENAILSKRQEKQEAKTEYERLSRLFHDKQEVEELYSKMSLLALNYNMLVKKVEKGQEVPMFFRNFELCQ